MREKPTRAFIGKPDACIAFTDESPEGGARLRRVKVRASLPTGSGNPLFPATSGLRSNFYWNRSPRNDVKTTAHRFTFFPPHSCILFVSLS